MTGKMYHSSLENLHFVANILREVNFLPLKYHQLPFNLVFFKSLKLSLLMKKCLKFYIHKFMKFIN